MAAEWADDEMLTPAMVQAAADAEYAWMVLSVGEYLPGWTFGREGLQGPMMIDMADRIMRLQMSATDYVVQHLDEIKAECVAEVMREQSRALDAQVAERVQALVAAAPAHTREDCPALPIDCTRCTAPATVYAAFPALAPSV